MILTWILFFSFLGSVGSILVAGSFLLLPERIRTRIVPWMLSYAAGILLAVSLLGILPHALEDASPVRVLEIVLGGLILFFLLEKMVLWHHCHHGEWRTHHPSLAAGPMILFGDGLHNFVDGVVLAATFLTSIPLGMTTAAAVIAHEIPHEVGDFAILLHSGYSRRKALLANIASGLTTILGALLGYFALPALQGVLPPILALAAASFLYIAMVDIIPELHRHVGFRESGGQMLVLLIGVGTIVLLASIHRH